MKNLRNESKAKFSWARCSSACEMLPFVEQVHRHHCSVRVAVIALEDCSEEFRKHIQECRQTKHDSAIYCDTDSDAEEQMAQAWWWSGAAQPARSAAHGIGKKPIVARHCDSRRRTQRVTNCSMKEAARRKARKEYASEA